METEQGIVPFQFDAHDAAEYIGMSVSWLWNSDIPRVRLGTAHLRIRADGAA